MARNAAVALGNSKSLKVLPLLRETLKIEQVRLKIEQVRLKIEQVRLKI
jgi:uncharacterized protein involved in outer membrane biogenesis